ncbi:MAG TPA: hypothetical protein VN648_05685, partial [Candidatus Methylomirabilis sp.]|nr:hypothetical protein [Candidatus Methylomirabilis sp.]
DRQLIEVMRIFGVRLADEDYPVVRELRDDRGKIGKAAKVHRLGRDCYAGRLRLGSRSRRYRCGLSWVLVWSRLTGWNKRQGENYDRACPTQGTLSLHGIMVTCRLWIPPYRVPARPGQARDDKTA